MNKSGNSWLFPLFLFIDKENSMKTIQEVRNFLNSKLAVERDPATL